MGHLRGGRPASVVTRGHASIPRPASVPILVVAIVALLASCAGPAPSPLPSTTPYPSPASASPTSSGAPSAEPSGEPQAWTQLTLPPSGEVATLQPTRAGRAGVAIDTAFTLTSLDGRAPADLAAHLVSEPTVSFKVVSTNGATATVRPTRPLLARTQYRISLTRADGSVEATWAAQTAGPLHVVETIPGDEATGVPRDTGIEVTFDQGGVSASDLADHFRISPATKGRFEAAGRTIAFVPDSPLAKGRVYTVTVTHGLPLAGTGQVLGADVVFRFETTATRTSDVTVAFARSFVEATPRERAAMTVYVDVPEDGEPPATIPVTIHRLPTMSAAISAVNTLRTAPSWVLVSTTEPVSTAGLTRVGKANVQLHDEDWGFSWIQLPDRLDAGWYLVTETFGGVPRQTVLQVTDLATFTMLTTTRSAFWVNDLATGKALAGVTVDLGGKPLGATDDRGLLVAATPEATKAGDAPWTDALVVVRDASRTAFQPVWLQQYCAGCAATPSVTDAWWHLFTSDRGQYRTTDTVVAWGVLRDRDSGRVPASVTVALLPEASSDEAAAPIATTTAAPDASGAFAATIPFRDLPVGGYRLVLRTGTTQVGELWLQVATIVKPAYRLTVTTDRHAVITGRTVTASVDAAFFEGTPVAGTKLSLFADTGVGTAVATTDSQGHASAPVKIRIDEGEQWSVTAVEAIPTLPEEAEISALSEVAVFRASAIVDADAALSGTKLSVTGRVNDVAFDRFEAADGSLWDVDPHGAPRANAAVKVRIVEVTPVRQQTGTQYDFITKRVVPRYDYSERTSTLATTTVRTGSDGTFRLTRTVTGGDRSYRVYVSYVDEGSRTVTAEAYAWSPVSDESTGAWLESADGDHQDGEYSIGDAVRVRFTGGIDNPPVARYLYAITQRGLQYVTVGTTPTFRTTFVAASVPGITISAVRFNGHGYDLAIDGWLASLRRSDRELSVRITSDRASYAPGDTATISIRTLGPDGAPVAASVFVTVIDEKLYAMGAAEQGDPLAELYDGVGDGIIGWASSHRTPADDNGDGKGDTTGGGGDDGRSDFRDWLLARLVQTGADGRATVAVRLSDDLTSWHVGASAVDRALDAGAGTGYLAVGLPLFAEATIATEYLVADRPVIRVRAFGSGLTSGETVTFTVSSDTLLMSGVTATAKAFQAAEIALPALSVGTHRIRIAASVGSGASARSDVLTRTFRVVTSRATRLETTSAPLDAAAGVTAGSGLTQLTLVDAGRGRVVPILDELAWTSGGRSDLLLAAALADRVLADEFGLPAPTVTGEGDLDPYTGLDEGLPIVPYGSANLDVTVLAALAGDPRLDASRLSDALQAVIDDPDTRRDRQLLALAGLAGLGEPVLGDLQAAAALSDLTVDEKVEIALGAVALGDDTLARSIERELLAAYGRRLGPWVRLDAPSTDATLLTARLAIVAASLGDPVAVDMDAWVAANPPRTTSVALERALAARGWARRVAGSTAVAALTVDGTRREVTVKPAEPVSVQLTPAQAAGARIEPVSGSVLVVTTREIPLDATSLTPATGQELERTVTPIGAIGLTDTVIVSLKVTLGPEAGNECWRVVDLAPSGLAPISVRGTWYDEEMPWTGESPDSVDGQRVEFCVSRAPNQPVQTLRYVARVVDPGTYAWEPAVLQSTVVPDQGVATRPATISIRGASGR